MDATRHERIMETPQKAIEFVNAPVRHRTAQIAPKKWEKHRLRITELYLASKNVAEVMKRMQSECGFYANKRQYTHILRKWGVKKRTRGPRAIPRPSPIAPDGLDVLDEPSSQPENPTHGGGEDDGNPAFTTKISQVSSRATNWIRDPDTVMSRETLMLDDGTQYSQAQDGDNSGPMETLSKRDIADMKHAAECLSLFHCDKEAFELYITILKRQLSGQTHRDDTSWHLLIQCAHTACIPEHIEVIQNILRAEKLTPATSYHDPAHILLNMLLALTSSRSTDPKDAPLHIAEARSHLPADDQGLEALFMQLPYSNRSLAQSFYRNMLRLQTADPCDLISPAPFDFTPFDIQRDRKMPHEEWILYAIPDPFEIRQNGMMGNLCIRCCVDWCEDALQILTSLSVTHGVVDACEEKDGIAWAEANALFFALWEHWAAKGALEKSYWAGATQFEMGISATELLLLVCRAIHDSYYPWTTPAKTNDELLQGLRKKAEELSKKTDLELARRVLRQYVLRNTVVTLWPPGRSAVRKLERARMVGSLEQVMSVHLPGLGGPARDLIDTVLKPLTEKGQPKHYAIIDETQQPSPTFASSLSSADLTNMKKIGISALVRIGRLRRGASSVWSLSRSGTASSMSGVSNISTSPRFMSLFGESVEEGVASPKAVSTIDQGSIQHSQQPGVDQALDSERVGTAI